MAITLDFESSNPGSTPGRNSFYKHFFIILSAMSNYPRVEFRIFCSNEDSVGDLIDGVKVKLCNGKHSDVQSLRSRFDSSFDPHFLKI